MTAYTPGLDFVFSAESYTPGQDFNFSSAIGGLQGTITADLDDAVGSIIAFIVPEAEFQVSLDDVSGTLSAFIRPAAVIDAVLDDLSGALNGNYFDNQAVILATLDETVGGMIGNYDPNVTRWISSQIRTQAQDTQTGQDKTCNIPRNQGIQSDISTESVQQDGSGLDAKRELRQDQAQYLVNTLQDRKATADSLRSQVRLLRDQATVLNKVKIRSVIERSSRLVTALQALKQQMTKVYPDRWRVPLQYSGEHQFDFFRVIQLEPPPEYRYTPSLDFNFVADNNYMPDGAFEWLYGQTGNLATGHNFGVTRSSLAGPSTNAIPFNRDFCESLQEARKPLRGKSIWIDTPRQVPDPDPPSGNTYQIPVLETYTMQFNTSVTLEDLTPIEVDNIQLEIDADSFAWKFSADLLDVSQLSLIKPLPDGSAITLIVTINGYVWHVLVESLPHKRQFAKETVSISGRGKSAELAAPFYQATTGLQGGLLAIQQLAELHVPNGWTLNWQTVTWNVPGGAYSWQNRTPIQAIADIAEAAGAIIKPSRDSKTLNIIPRYPVLPWDFAGTTVDVAIPEDVILEVTHRDTSRQYANGVYVHGAEIGGEIGFCRLNGSAGDVLMQTYSNPLMTDVVGIRAQGERLLASEYTQPDISGLTVPMDGNTVPLIEVGTFIGVTIDGVETRGVVNSLIVRSSRDNTEISQQLRIGEDTNNQWIAFQNLLPKDPLLLGTLQSTDGSISTMQLLDGGVMNVRGTGTVNNKYYIRSGQIQGDAPNMTQSEIVI